MGSGSALNSPPKIMPIDFRDRVSRVLNHCKREFGEACTLYPLAGGEFPIRGIFDNEFRLVDPDTEQVVSANTPMLGVNLFDFDFDIKIKDKLLIRNVSYKIIDIREDGQGGASLFLHRLDHEKKVDKKKSP
jgi:hypothetical protein